MPLGESVGSAYVRIYADGSEVPSGIRDSLEDAEPSVREAGRRHGETYGEEFDKSVKGSYKKHFNTLQGEMFDDLNSELTDSLAKLELSNRFFKSKKWKEFQQRLENEFGDAGRLAGKSLEAQFRDSTDLDKLAAEMDRIGPRVRKAQERILREREREDKDSWVRMLTEAFALNKAFDADLRKLSEDRDRDFDARVNHMNDTVRAQLEEAYRLNVEYDRRQRSLNSQRDHDFERSVETNLDQVKRIEAAFKGVAAEIDKISRGEKSSLGGRSKISEMLSELDRQYRLLTPDVEHNRQRLAEWGHDLRLREKELAGLSPRMNRFTHDIEKGGEVIGRLFGKGSRNNFLNFFGTVVGGIASMFSIIPRTIGWVQKFGQTVGTAFTEAAREGGKFEGFAAAAGEAVTLLGGALLTGVAAIAAFIAFIGLLSVVLGPIIALLSGLVGIVVALAGSIAFALVGAVAAFLPLIIPLAGILGGVALAIKKFKDDAGPLGDLFDHLKKRAKQWTDLFSDEAFKQIGRYGDRIDEAFHGLGPLFDAAGKGFNRFLDRITEGLDSPAFKLFFDRFERFLPHAMNDLGEIISNVFSGLAGWLRASVPLANRLLDWLVDITGRFADWANSAKGQSQIQSFLDRAGDSAAAVGDFLRSAVEWLGKLLDKGKGTGDSIFKNMADDFDRWSQWLDDHPHAVQKWFGDAEALSHDIGDLIDKLNKFFDKLDTETNRLRGNNLVGLLGDIFEVLGDTVAQTDWLVGQAQKGLTSFASWLGWFFSTLGSGLWWFFGGQWAGALIDGIVAGVKAGAKEVWGAITGLWSGIKGIGGGGPKGGIGANLIDTSAITRAITNAIESLDKLPAAAGRVANRVGNAFSGVPGDIRGFINGIPGMVSGIFGRLPGPVQTAVRNMISYFGPLATGLLRATQTAVTVVAAWFTTLPGRVAAIPGQVVSLFYGLGQRILDAIGSVVIHVGIDMPSLPSGVGIKHAAGGIMFGPTTLRDGSIAGEAGAEALVPLNRPLALVDPAVRALSAYAQGKGPYGNDAQGRSIDASGWQIVTPSEDPKIVAQEMLDALVAKIN